MLKLEGLIVAGRSAVIIAAPGRLREGWRALLLAAPQVDAVYESDAQTAPATVNRFQPNLVLLDIDSVNEIDCSLLPRIKDQQPACCWIAVTSAADRDCSAEVIGADAVLQKGFAAEELFATVDRLLANGG